jgi:alkylated DNA repair dioxygenase AlkB
MSFVKDPVLPLFDDLENGIALPIEDGQLHYIPSAFSETEADALMRQCLTELPWRQDRISIAGKLILIPRLQCWLGDPEAHYSYSNLTLHPQPWPEFLVDIKARIETLAAHSFNSALANLYRDGSDSVDWHSDDEAELGHTPIIASLSLGTSRVFELKHRYKKQLSALKLSLNHGSVLIMKGSTQQYWHHRIAKLKGLSEPRINFTFRHILHKKVAR